MEDHIETERLLLRPTNTEDVEFIYRLMNTPKWIQNIGDRKITSTQKAAEYIDQKMTPQLESLGFSNYTVIRKTDQEKLGTCGLYDREGLDSVDIGFAFLPEYERKGYALEAASKLMQVGMDKFGLTIIDAITTKENSASQKLLEKLGLSIIGDITLPNVDETLLHYRIEKEHIQTKD